MAVSEIVPDAGWCWFGDPRAVHHNGAIYYGWTDSRGWIWVGQVDTATWTRRRFLIAKDSQIDDHDNPSILIRDGKVCVFWCGHRGPSMRYRIAKQPASIDDFDKPVVCTAKNTNDGDHGFTYPNPAQMTHDNAVYLLWRGGNRQPTWSRSTNLKRNEWTPARHLFSAPRNVRPYLKLHNDGQTRLRFLLTDGHPDEQVATSVYYAEWRLDTNTFRRADGTRLGTLQETPLPVVSLEKVYDGVANPRAWIWDLQFDPAGRAHAVFAVLKSRTEHEYWSARHDGSRWQLAKICDAGGTIAQDKEQYYSGGIALDPLDLDTVAVSRQARPDQLHRIERWRTGDGGATWQQQQVVSDADKQNVRPFYVRDAPAHLNWRLMWLRGTYGSYGRFDLSLVGAAR
jgi:BNR repeat-containing family member